jgi:hypothetical protein
MMTCLIEGMARVGKTQLAIHTGHLLGAERSFAHVLFVDLRGFHPDPAQPAADPAACWTASSGCSAYPVSESRTT